MGLGYDHVTLTSCDVPAGNPTSRVILSSISPSQQADHVVCPVRAVLASTGRIGLVGLEASCFITRRASGASAFCQDTSTYHTPYACRGPYDISNGFERVPSRAGPVMV